ncbi:MAG: hypothetical protein H7Y07_02325 [Pyrinomonadaceae bacterium]|nr:hypothetical protein [Sphingobacteriaceae bacterium]
MRKIIIICSVLLIAILALAGKYFTHLAGKDSNINKALIFIPSDAAIVLSFNNNDSFYEILKGYELFDVILGPQGRSELTEIQKFISQAPLKELALDKKVFITFHPLADSMEMLFIMNLDAENSVSHLQETLSGLTDITPFNTEGNIYQSGKVNPIYFHMEQGVAIASFSLQLLKNCISSKKPGLNKAFMEEINTASSRSQSSPVNLFIDHTSLSPFLLNYLNSQSQDYKPLLKKLKGKSSLSMNFKSDAIMFSGISTTDTLKAQFFNTFLHQRPAVNHIKNILPQNTSNFLAFSLSDVKLFQNDLQVYLKNIGQLKSLKQQLSVIQSNTGINLDRDLKPLWGNEFVAVSNLYGEKYAIMKLVNGRNVNFTLQLISEPINEYVSKLMYSNIFQYYFGDPLKSFVKPYFAVADNYLIIANTPRLIQNVLSDYENERFLSGTEGFKEYDKLVANQSNILYFVHNRNSKTIIRSSLQKKYSSLFSDENSSLKNFYGLSYQWSGDGDHFFSNLYLSYPSTDKQIEIAKE